MLAEKAVATKISKKMDFHLCKYYKMKKNVKKGLRKTFSYIILQVKEAGKRFLKTWITVFVCMKSAHGNSVHKDNDRIYFKACAMALIKGCGGMEEK